MFRKAFHEIPPHRITRLRRQGERYFADELRELPDNRRLAILAVCAVEWEMFLADARWWRPTTGFVGSSGTKPLRSRVAPGIAELGRALIGARDTGEALDGVIADGPGGDGLGDLCRQGGRACEHDRGGSVESRLGGLQPFPPLHAANAPHAGHRGVGGGPSPLLDAVGVLRSDGTARPTGFLRPNSKWRRLLRTQSDHRLWETAVLFHLRDAFHAGDVWLARSRRYGDIRKALLSTPVVADAADRSLPAPASPHDWLAERRFALDEGLRRLAAAARAGAIAGGSIEDRRGR